MFWYVFNEIIFSRLDLRLLCRGKVCLRTSYSSTKWFLEKTLYIYRHGRKIVCNVVCTYSAGGSMRSVIVGFAHGVQFGRSLNRRGTEFAGPIRAVGEVGPDERLGRLGDGATRGGCFDGRVIEIERRGGRADDGHGQHHHGGVLPRLLQVHDDGGRGRRRRDNNNNNYYYYDAIVTVAVVFLPDVTSSRRRGRRRRDTQTTLVCTTAVATMTAAIIIIIIITIAVAASAVQAAVDSHNS